MRHTPVTDYTAEIINETIMALEEFYNPKSNSCLSFEPGLIIDSLIACEENISTIDIENIKREFWETCEDFSKISSLRHIYRVKFQKLLD